MTKGFWEADAVETKPDMATLAARGYPTDGDPARGIPATLMGAAWFYLMDRVRTSVIEGSGRQLEEVPTETEFLEALQSWGWGKKGTLPGELLKTAAINTNLLADGSVTLAKMAKELIATSAQAADKSNAQTIITPARMHEVINSYLMPAGTIVSYAGASVPSGWLLCNGANVSRTTYANLFRAIGTKWGAGDGSTTFALPDSDGRVLQGATDVSKVGKYLEAGLPNITGTVSGAYGGYIDTPNVSSTGSLKAIAKADYVAQAGGAQTRYTLAFDASDSSNVYSSNIVQPTACQTLIIIKV